MVTDNPSSHPFHLPAFDRDRALTAARTTAACLISLCIVLIYRFPEGHWALITCLVMTQASIGASIDKGMLRIAGTVVGCLLAVLVLSPLNQSPLPFVAITFAILFAAAYLGSGTYYPYAFVIGGLTLVMVAVLGFRGQNASVSMGLGRTGEILVGVVVSWFTAFALWPRRASLQIDEQIQRTLESIARTFDAVTGFVLGGRPPPETFRGDLDAIAPGIRKILGLLPAAAREGRDGRHRAVRLRSLSVHLERLRSTFLPLAVPVGPLPNPFAVALRPELEALFATTAAALETLCRPDPDAFEESASAIRPARRALERRMDEIHASGDIEGTTAEESLAFHGLLATLRETENSLNAIGRTLFDLESMDEPSQGLFDRARNGALDPPRIRFAAKTALAVCFTVYLLNLLQWSGSVSAMITTFIVAQLSIGGSVRKAMLRLSGAFLGGVLALGVILFITPYIVSLSAFSLVVCSVLFWCAYAYTGPEKSAYAGLQTGLAFVIVLLAGPKQETSLMPGVSRLVGVMIGTAISIGVESLLWPSHAYVELRDRIRQSLSTCGTLFGDLAAGFRGPFPDRESLLARSRRVRARLVDSSQILGEALLEGPRARREAERDLPAASATEELMHRIARLAVRFDHPVAPSLRASVGESLDELLDATQETLARLPRYLDGDAAPADIDGDGDALRALNRRLVDALEVARQQHRFREHPEDDVSYFVGLLDAIVRIAQGTAVTCGSLSRRQRT